MIMGKSNSIDIVTTEQFVTIIITAIKEMIRPMGDDCSSGYMDYALNRGIIEDYDIGKWDYPIERRAAARIAHEALLTEIGERDEEDWSAANNLLDLYTCRTCVIHIGQMYAKGIMLGRDNSMFEVKGRITCSEARSIAERILDREKRTPQTGVGIFIYKKLFPNEALELHLKDDKTMIIDVRTHEEYGTGHIKGSICIPLNSISNNPFSICENKKTPIILYCQRGYKSAVVAQILIEAGYSKVYTIPGIEQHKYRLCN